MLTQFQSLAPKEERNSISPLSFNGYMTSIINEANNDGGNHVRCEVQILSLDLISAWLSQGQENLLIPFCYSP